MAFTVESTHLGEVVVLRPDVHDDGRGFFMESFRADQVRALGLPTEFVQDNHSRSQRGVIRGLHVQWDPPMGKLMRVTHGAAFVVAVDLRKGSPTLGQWFGAELSADNKKQMWAPYGFARGFCTLTDDCEVQYKCTGIYNPRAEASILHSDPRIGIRWPIDPGAAIVSERDRKAVTLEQWLSSPSSENIKYHAKTAVPPR